MGDVDCQAFVSQALYDLLSRGLGDLELLGYAVNRRQPRARRKLA